MKAIDVIKMLSTRIDSQELIDLTTGTDELNEDQAQNVKNAIMGLLTVDSARNNPEIVNAIKDELYPTHKKTILKQFEDKIKPLADKLGLDLTGKEFASDQFDLLSTAIETKLSEGFTGDTSLIESLKKDKSDLLAQIETNKGEHEGKINDINKAQTGKELYRNFENKFNTYKLAESYDDEILKDSLKESLWKKITATTHLELSDQGIKVFEKEMPDKELYRDNKLQTLETLIEPQISKYLKKADTPKVVVVGTGQTVFKNAYQEKFARANA